MKGNKPGRTGGVQHNTFAGQFKEMENEERELYLFMRGGFAAFVPHELHARHLHVKGTYFMVPHSGHL